MNQPIEIPKWWEKTAKFLLIVTVCAVLIYSFSFWAINAEYFGKYNLSKSIGYTFYSVISLLLLLGAIFVSIAGIATGYILNYPIKRYLIVFVISLASILYINTFHS